MTDGPRGGRRSVFALAVSLLLHAGAAFIGVLSIGGGREEAPVVEDRVGKLLRPVQITLVPMSPRNSILTPATTPAPPATDPPPKPDREMAKAEPPPPPEPAPPPEPKPPTPPEPPAVTPAVKPRAVEQHPEPPAPSPPSPAPKQERTATTPAAPAIASATRTPSLNPGKTAGHDSRPGPSPLAPTPSTTGGSTANRPPGRAAATKDSTSKPEPGAAGPGARSEVEIVTLPTPEYPPRSRRLGEEGVVLLDVEVLPDGRAGEIRILQAPPYPRLVDAAIEAVRKAQFKPAMSQGVPVSAKIEIPIRFRLD